MRPAPQKTGKFATGRNKRKATRVKKDEKR